MRERERYLVLNPGPPRKKKRVSRKRNPTASYNADLVSELQFLTARIGNIELSETDRSLVKLGIRRLRNLLAELS